MFERCRDAFGVLSERYKLCREFHLDTEFGEVIPEDAFNHELSDRGSRRVCLYAIAYERR